MNFARSTLTDPYWQAMEPGPERQRAYHAWVVLELKALGNHAAARMYSAIWCQPSEAERLRSPAAAPVPSSSTATTRRSPAKAHLSEPYGAVTTPDEGALF